MMENYTDKSSKTDSDEGMGNLALHGLVRMVCGHRKHWTKLNLDFIHVGNL